MAGVNLAQRLSNSEGPDNRLYLMRSPSAASDVTTKSTSLVVPPTSPAPAYFAQTAASEWISSELDRTVLVSRSALALVNEFLDQVLYNIYLTSRSTSLSSLKVAVPSVLKPRLGKVALGVAEDELKEYLNDEEEHELNNNATSAELRHEFEPELAWKLARLRCMVYARHGDLEEDDEEDWLDREGLRGQLQAAQQSSQVTISTGPASAIFLTAIVEFLGEQALYYAAQHAQKRHDQSGGQQVRDEEADAADITTNPDDVIIGSRDMNHVGRDSPLSRLWRSYRRNTRETSSRPISPEVRASSALAKTHSRGPSSVAQERAIVEETRSPDQIPLPMSSNDVNEIEVPGLASGFSDDEDEPVEENTQMKQRPASMIFMPGQQRGGSVDSTASEAPKIPERNPKRPTWTHRRSMSSPVGSLPRASGSSQNLLTRDDLWSRDRREDVQSQSPMAREPVQPPTTRNERSSFSLEDDVVDANVAATTNMEAEALEAPRAAVKSRSVQDAGQPGDEDDDLAHSEATLPKRTVAEEMLGVMPSVAPPQDAATGASITNMDDFDSMHIPVALPSDQGSPITPSMVRDDILFPSRGDDAYTLGGQTDGAADDSRENLKPAPLRTISGRGAAMRPSTNKPGLQTPVTAKDNLNIITPKSPDNDMPMSAASTTGSLPTSPSSAVVGTAVPVIPPRSAPTQVRHVKVDSRGSLKEIGNRNSSDANRTTDLGRKVSGRSQTGAQPQSTGVSAAEASLANLPPTISNISRDPNPVTASSSVSKRFHGKPLQIADESDEAKKKSLEILIRGNETLHYTLTPAAAMRDEKTRSQYPDTSDNARVAGLSAQESTSRAGPGMQSGALPKTPLTPSRIVPRPVAPATPSGVISPSQPTQARNPLGQPRDPRPEKSSNIQDLADYARSTGPLDAKQLPKPISPRTGLPSSPRPTSASTTTTAAAAKAQVPAASRQPKTPSSPKASRRMKQQARDPRAARGNDSSELIDFIREGPPSTMASNEGREHRIDRRVAPFRTTMDSDDFDQLAQGRVMGSSLRRSEDGRPAPSADPSVTSQTPLMMSQAGRGVVPAAPTNNQSSTDSDGMPKRTRRRIKDPYAIDDSDEDEELERELGTNTRRQEESLIDFLRNASPPASGSTPQPILAGRAGQRSSEQAQAAGARESSPHLTQSGSKIDKYRPTQPTHAAHVDRNRESQPGLASPRASDRPRSTRRFEARDAKATRENTAELAEYFRNSGPPPNAQFQPQPFVLSSGPSQKQADTSPPPEPAPKEDGGLFKRFSKQRKK